jgi:hypothetical protein
MPTHPGNSKDKKFKSDARQEIDRQLERVIVALPGCLTIYPKTAFDDFADYAVDFHWMDCHRIADHAYSAACND